MFNKCKYLKIRTKNYEKYFYCSFLHTKVRSNECFGCSSAIYKELAKVPKRGIKTQNKRYKKNSKISKLERNRMSVFTDNLDKCILCDKPKVNLHEVIFGKNRINSMKYGFVIPVCLDHHLFCHKDKDTIDYWHCKSQKYFEANLGTREEFISIFGRNYLE